MRQRLGWIFLALWAPSTIVIIALLMVNHTIAMPSPTRLSTLEQGVTDLRGAHPTLSLHIIAANCSCTDNLVDHLVRRGADGVEMVLFVGPMRARHRGLPDAGFEVRNIGPDELDATLAVPAAPLLVTVLDKRITYVGGYFRYPAAVRPLDEEIRTHTLSGSSMAPLPVFGCAVDPVLRRTVDPLGLQSGSF